MRRVLGCNGITKPFTAAVFPLRSQAVPARMPLHAHDSFLVGTSADYIESMFHQWKADPASVESDWSALFTSPRFSQLTQPLFNEPVRVASNKKRAADAPAVEQSLADCARLTYMIQAFEDRGHLMASLDPLSYEDEPTKRIPSRRYKESLRLDLESFGFAPADYDKVVRVGFRDNVGGFLNSNTPPMTIRELHTHLKKTYCGNIGFEFSHISDENISCFLRETIENQETKLHRQLTVEDKKWIWHSVAEAVMFEDFFKRKFGEQKRFGLDGGESLVAGLRALLNQSSAHGVEQAYIGMAHRGRLNILTHIAGKPFNVLLKEFKGVKADELKPYKMQSDVKYHLGAANDMTMRNGKTVRVDMLFNPSHLEAVNPFVQGTVRAEQFLRGDKGKQQVLPIEIHGDAAFAGQGVVFETMGLSEIGQYGTGGTVHLVCNNQIGFTTDPKSSRSSAYCTDLGRTFQCPIFHVNGDSPEDVVKVFELAADYRSKYGRSVVIDFVCYRRYGHNENDDPSMTQPLMYERIKNHRNIFEIYSAKLQQDGVVTADEVSQKRTEMKRRFDTVFENPQEVRYYDYIKSNIPLRWKSMDYSDAKGTMGPTAVSHDNLGPVISALKTFPPDFNVHKGLAERVLKRRTESLLSGKDIEWGTAEALAFGSLLNEGIHVRVSGQDVERATFSQRNAVLHDQKTNATYTNLDHVSPTQAPLTITNSSLSEYGVLGFECGYSQHNPNALVMWEAQFGDFANGAQIIFDQFLSAGESKWNVQQAVVVSMPHGYDGNGPEHSSGRIERFLQSVAEDIEAPVLGEVERHQLCNMEVTFPSTPAQYFHLLRRHVKRSFRKPLINFFSKQFLRAPNVSSLEEMTAAGSCFQPVIPDISIPTKEAKRLVLCSGQIYHILNRHRQAKQLKNVAIVRLEQLAPFPAAEVRSIVKEYEHADLVWVQEEPKNMGAFWHVEPRIEFLCGRKINYIGRQASASPATGFKSCHDNEEQQIVTSTFTV